DTTLDIDLSGTTPGSGYDNLTYESAPSGGCHCVELNDATLDVALNFTPTPGTTFSIISRAEGSAPRGPAARRSRSSPLAELSRRRRLDAAQCWTRHTRS
ncbi:MAG: hypothetical protein R3300_15305, partial [Candidatus Promineifilaceae bacterium]|nr:hypothetical protein [Candidatus Promineifilaceae bacterium]